MSDEQNTTSTPKIFTVKVKDVERAAVGINRDIPLGWLTSELAACEYPIEPLEAHTSIELSSIAGGVLVRGRVVARLQIECGICLTKSALELRPEVNCFLQPRSSTGSPTEDEELTPEDLEREWYDGDTIVLDSLLRDSVVLELPMNPRCQSDCTGLADHRSAPPAQEIDPRLAPLASIKLPKE
jgi:uncharacterized protein